MRAPPGLLRCSHSLPLRWEGHSPPYHLPNHASSFYLVTFPWLSLWSKTLSPPALQGNFPP